MPQCNFNVLNHLEPKASHLLKSALTTPEPPAKKPRTTPIRTEKPETPEQKELRETVAKRKQALTKLQSKFTGIRSEASVAHTNVVSIEKKGLPKEFVTYLRDQVDAVVAAADAAAQFYAAEIIRPDKRTVEDLADMKLEIEATMNKTTEMETLHQKCKDGIFSTCKKNA